MFTLRNLIEGEHSLDSVTGMLYDGTVSGETYDDFYVLWYESQPSNWDGKSLGWTIWYWSEIDKCEIVLGKVHPIAQEHAYRVLELVSKAYGCTIAKMDITLAGIYYADPAGPCVVAQPYGHPTDPTGRQTKEE